MSYGTSAHDYLKRAEFCLRQNDPKYLFYAAFELRCAVETRLREYLDAWDHVSKKQKEGWEVAKLGSATERAFKTDRVMRLSNRFHRVKHLSRLMTLPGAWLSSRSTSAAA